MIRRALSALFVLVLLAGCGGARRGGGDGAALGHARPRRRAARRRGGRRRADADARARLEGRRQDALRRAVRPVRERDRGQPPTSATGSGSSTATRATAAPPRTSCATATSPGSTTARGSARAKRASSSAPSRSRSCTGTPGRTRPLSRFATSLRWRAVPARSRGTRRGAICRRFLHPVPEERTCSRCDAGLLGAPASCSARPRAIPCASCSAALRLTSGGTAFREPGPAAVLLAAAGMAALLTDGSGRSPLLALVLLAVCLRAPAERRGVYLFGALMSGLGVLVLSPFLWSSPDGTVLWEGPDDPGARPARRDHDGALRSGAERASGWWRSALHSPRTRSSSITTGWSRRPAARAVPRSWSRWRRASCPRSSAMPPGRGVRAGPRRRASRARGATRRCSPADGRLARARHEPGGGNGGARLRALRRDARATAALDLRDRLAFPLARPDRPGGALWL